MSTTASSRPASASTEDPRATARRKVPPVTLWALLGAVLLAFEIYVVAAWISGPYFTSVPTGPDEPPQWMKIVLNTLQVVGPIAMLIVLWNRLASPWIRRREITFDGLICIAMFLLSFWDANSAYFQQWFTYNPYLLNRGSLVYEIPGWMSYGDPQHQIAWPYLVMPPSYAAALWGLMVLGCWFLSTVRRRFPNVSDPVLVACSMAFMAFCDIFVEGFGFIMLGVWSYPGAPSFALFGEDTRWRYPACEMVVVGVCFGTLTCLRFFRNDKGLSLVERGLERTRGGVLRQAGYRLLALIAATQVIMFATYHLPTGLLAVQSHAWPAEVAGTTWMNSGLCGKGTDRACPGPNVPIPRPSSPHLDPAGNLVR